MDHVCLKETTTCVYKGNFLQEIATEVVATRGCPGQEAETTEISFKVI